jgi:hypothetical protein
MALTEPERIIFSKTINAGLGAMPLYGYAAIWAALPPYSPIMFQTARKRLEVFSENF